MGAPADPSDRSNAAPVVGESSEVCWLREWRTPDSTVFRIGRQGGDLVAEWDGLGMLRASGGAGDVRVSPVVGLPASVEARWRRGAVRGLLCHLEGRAALHASAVALCGRAVLLLGESGAGKSTCAAFLCASADAELLADDVAEIDLVAGGPLVRPVEADNWLFGDSAAVVGASAPEDVKAPVVAPRAAQAAVPLGAVVVLEFDDAAPAPRVEPIRGQAAFAAVNAAYVRFAIDDVEVHLRDLDAIARIVAASAVVRLSRPRSLDALADTAALLCELASRVSAAACQEGT